MHQLQREIYFRDSLIKCLSDRLKVLCKANDKLIIDYENQENILSEELICLKHQLEKAKDAMRSLSFMKSRSNITRIQDIEGDAYYLRESLRTKEIMISDLKHRLDQVSLENSDLKCELNDKNALNLRYSTTSHDRELMHINRKNDQLLAENESLKTKVECKSQIITDLQMKLNCGTMNQQDHCLINQLRDELLLANEDNEMTKEAILEQSEMLEDFKNQIKILSENNTFKDDTILELRCCVRQLTECQSPNVPMRDTPRNKCTDERGSQSLENSNLTSLLSAIKRYVNQNQPNLMEMFDSELDPYCSLEKFMMDLVSMMNKTPNNNSNDIELFKEFLTNEINLKNNIIKYLATNLTENIGSVDKLQAQMNSILSSDMDRGFKNDLKNYLHQCFLLDDHLRSVLEDVVKSLNNRIVRNKTLSMENDEVIDRFAMYVPDKLRNKQSIDTNSRMTHVTTNTPDFAAPFESNNIQKLEEELRILNNARQQDQLRFNSEVESNIRKLEILNKKIADMQRLLDGKSNVEVDYKKLNSDYQEIVHKSRQCHLDNDRLKGELEDSLMKNQQLERNLNLKNSELGNLEASVRRVSDQFANLSSTQDLAKDAEIERLNKEMGKLKHIEKDFHELKRSNDDQLDKITAMSRNIESLEDKNQRMAKQISSLEKELEKCNKEKKDSMDSITKLREEKNKEIDELLLKVHRDSKLKYVQTDPNDELTDMIEKLKRENKQMEMQLKQEESQSMQLRTTVNTLTIENKTFDMKIQSLIADKAGLENQVKQLRDRIGQMNESCEENHVSKQLMRKENEQSDLCKQKIMDLESILKCLTDELNEKALLVENLRKSMRKDSDKTPSLDFCANLNDAIEVKEQMLLQKDSEIAFLKSKIHALEIEKSSKALQKKNSPPDRMLEAESQRQILMATITELENRIEQLNQQLTERSENVTLLQKLLNEKDEIIEKSNKIINENSVSCEEAKKMLHLMSLENKNMKDELSTKSSDGNKILLLQSTINNLTSEIQNFRTENDQLRNEIRRLNAEIDALMARKSKIQSSDFASHSKLPDSSVQQINNEIHKLYVDFEGKSNEIKEYSLKEINSRDKRIEDLNLELKLKSDQFTTIVVENRRLQDRIEDDSQKSSKYEHNLLLKEQLLQKMLREKEKIRATFITELQDKNAELGEKSKTVYFLNAELHRLASELEIMSSELHVTKLSDKYEAHSKNVLEISQANLDTLKAENHSLKLCVNLKMAETESMKQELTIKQINDKALTDEVHLLNSKSNDHENEKKNFLKVQADLQKTVDSLKHQLKEIQDDYRNIVETKSKLESAVRDLEKENLSLKHVKEKLDNEKMGFKNEIEDLKSKIESLNNDLDDYKNKIARKSLKYENEQEEVRRLSGVLDAKKIAIANHEETMAQAIRQIEELTAENLKYKLQVETLSRQFHDLKAEYQRLSANLDKSHEDAMAKERELMRYKDMEAQLDSDLKHKSADCEQLKYDYEELVKQCEQFQQKVDDLEMQEKKAYRMMEQKTSQCNYIQDSLEQVKNQLYVTEDKMKMCNNQWLDKYGQLKNSFHQMEYECQNQLDAVTQDRNRFEATAKNHSNKLNNMTDSYHKLTEDNAQLNRENCQKNSEIERLCCEKNSLQNCNAEMASQIELTNSELLAAHSEICQLTVQLHESQGKINEFSFKLKENLSSVRHYGSHPLLNQPDRCGSFEHMNFEERDYCDLKTRYCALCGQIDSLICQLRKKDKRIMDIQSEYDQVGHKLQNYDQIQCDYQDLDYKYQQLKDDFNNLSHYYQNINFSHQKQNLQMEDDEVNIIQICASELQDTIDCQNLQLDSLRSSNQVLMNDYQMCCVRMKELEEQVQIDNMELEKWHQDYCTMENNYKELEDKYDEGLVNEYKQEIIDKTTRIMEITNMNENIEQQLNCQNQMIEDLKMKIHNLESFYEQELELCRHDQAGMNQGSGMNEQINCLKEQNKSLEFEMLEQQNQFHVQCLSYHKLRQEHDCEMGKVAELRHEYEEQCRSIDKISAQLFDKNDLVEQLTNENRHIISDLEVGRLKISQLNEQTESLNRCLTEKDNELTMSQKNLEIAERSELVKERESIGLSNHAEYLTEQIDQRTSVIEGFRKELALCYETIDSMKAEQVQICEELNNLNGLNAEKDQCIFAKNELLTQYCKELELNYELIQKLQFEKNPKTSVSVKEFCELKLQNDKLVQEVDYLQHELGITGQPIEPRRSHDTQQSGINDKRHSNIASPNSDSRIYVEQEQWPKDGIEKQKSICSELTYSTSKSVAWQKTCPEPPANMDCNVYELQKAIDEYNTLVTSIEMSDTGLNIPFEDQSEKKFKKSSNFSEGKGTTADISNLSPRVDIDVPNRDEVDVYVVDVESMITQARTLDQNVPIDVQNVAHEDSLRHACQIDGTIVVNQPEFRDVIDLLRNCNVQIDYDESKEPFDTYFYRMMQKYNELEQFYLASMKINLDDAQDLSSVKSMEIFTELYEKSNQKLIQHCQLLKSSVDYGTLEMTDDVAAVNEQKLTTEERTKLIDLVKTQKLQLTALHLTHDNLEKITPGPDEKSQKITSHYLTPEYQEIWLVEDVCEPNIVLSTLKVNRLSEEGKMSIPSKSKTRSAILSSSRTSMENLKMKPDSARSISKASVGKSITSVQPAKVQSIITTQESIHNKSQRSKLESASKVTEPSIINSTQRSSTGRPTSTMVKSDTKSINFGRTSDLNYQPESLTSSAKQEDQTRVHPSIVSRSGANEVTKPSFQHNYQGVSMPEGKTRQIKNLEDSVGHASVEQFEKEMHTLKSVDLKNIDSSVKMDDQIRIYAAEMDYLNEKNLFQNFTIAALTNLNQHPQNAAFINQISDSLTAKANFIIQLESEFKFEPHISKNEKALIKKVLDPKNDFTYRKLFESSIAERRLSDKHDPPAGLTNKINELTKKLEYCQSQLNSPDRIAKDNLIETLLSDKKCLVEELNEWKQKVDALKSKLAESTGNEAANSKLQDCKATNDKLNREIQNLKEQLKSSAEKVQDMSQHLNNDQMKQSKIPLLRGSNIEAPLPNVRIFFIFHIILFSK